MSNSMFVIAPKADVRCGDKTYTIELVLDLQRVLAKDHETGKKVQLLIKDLAPMAAPDEKVEHQEISLIDADDWKEAERWLKLLSPLIGVARRTRAMVEEVARAAGVHFVTVYRKLKQYEDVGLTSALVPTRPNGGRGKSRLPENVEAVIQETIKEFWIKGRRRKVTELFEEVRRKLKNNHITPPHKNTLYNRVKALTQREKDEAMLGEKAAGKKHSAHPNKFPGADFPLAVTQIDHTKLDIQVVDDVYRLSICRPWITLLMDVFSRMVLGFYISLDPPNSMSVGLCLARAILPKDAWLTGLNIDIPWPCWGFMRKIHADNAGEFRGSMLKDACTEYNIDLEWRPVKKPHYGAHIERLLGTFAQEVHTLPGTTFSNTKDKGDYDSEKEASLTLSELERNLTLFIVGEYHQRKHSALNLSPIKQMEKGVFGTERQAGTGLPTIFFDEDRLRLDLMPYEKRTIQPSGVVIDKINYYSSVFDRYVGLRDPDRPNRKPKFIFKRDPRNIKYVYFYDPNTKPWIQL